ncbi:MAG: HAD-IA family hydrolase [Planctomycetota bacterium]
MKALLIGSMGVLADTSERQRDAYNRVFAEHGVPIRWSQDDYQALLRHSGGQRRIAQALAAQAPKAQAPKAHAAGAKNPAAQAGAATGTATPNAAALHRQKAERFQRDVRENGVACRPGVVATIRDAQAAGCVVGFVTTTDAENLRAILSAAPDLSADDFAFVLHQQDVTERKPHPEVYRLAVQKLGLSPADCVAVEDNTDGLASAVAAGVRCYAFPGENNVGHDFAQAERVLEVLSFATLAGESPAASGP